MSTTSAPIAFALPKTIPVSITLTPAQWAALMNTVPSTPQSFAQLLAAAITLPAGMTPAQIETFRFSAQPNGGAQIVIQLPVAAPAA